MNRGFGGLSTGDIAPRNDMGIDTEEFKGSGGAKSRDCFLRRNAIYGKPELITL